MKAKKWACVATAALMAVTVGAIFAGCTEGEDPKPQDDKLTVTWYDNRNVLKTDEVESGSTVKEWTPKKDGFVFTGWYEEASLGTPFKFDTKIVKDTQIYSAWRSDTVQSDTRIWYAIGSGAETLKASNWTFATKAAENDDGVILDENGYATFTKKEGFDSLFFKKEDNSSANIFTLTLTLRPGDKFRFLTNAINSDWTGDKGKAEAGLGSIEGFEYAAGVNPEAKGEATEVTLESKEYGVVKIDNEVVFEGGKEYNADPKGWNLFLAEGQDGEYKFTLTTYPGEDANNTLKVERVKKLEPLKATHKMHIIGSMNNWDNAHPENLIAMTESEDKSTWTGFVTVTEAAEMKVYNSINGGWFGDATGANFKLEAGTYAVKYTVADDKVEIEKCEYYLVGTIRINDKNYDFADIDPTVQPKLTKSEDGATYTITYDVTDVSNVDGYTWLKDKEGNPIAAFQVVLGSSLGVKDWHGVGGDGNYYATEAGSYTFTLSVADGKLTVTKN